MPELYTFKTMQVRLQQATSDLMRPDTRVFSAEVHATLGTEAYNVFASNFDLNKLKFQEI